MKDWDEQAGAQVTEGVSPPVHVAEAGPHRRFGPRVAWLLFASGLIAGMILAGLNIAGAQTPTPSPSVPGAPNIEKRMFRHGPGHHGFGFGKGAIHGEFTTRAPNGGFQTMATQIGEVTSVSASSITVRSEDGYSRTYSVDDNTLVNAGNDGIADVKKGDDVHITGIVSGGKARAVDIGDLTQTRALREKWAPRPPALPQSGSQSG